MDRYLLHPPVSIERMTYDESLGQVIYHRKRDRGFGATKTFDALDFLARSTSSVATATESLRK